MPTIELGTFVILNFLGVASLIFAKKYPVVVFLGALIFAIIGAFLISDYSVIMTNTETGNITTVNGNNTLLMDVNSFSGTTQLNNGLATIAGEKVTSLSQLLGKDIDTMQIYLSKTGSPTGLVQLGVFDSNGVQKYSFGSIDSQLLTTQAISYTFNQSPFQKYTLQLNDRVGVMFTGGDGSNFVKVSADSNNPFDGTNTVLDKFNTGVWTTTTGTDLLMHLSIHSDAVTAKTDVSHISTIIDKQQVSIGYIYLVIGMAIFIIFFGKAFN